MPPAADNSLIFSFGKSDKLKSPFIIESLLHLKNVEFQHPIKCYYKIIESSSDKNVVKAAFSVPKKKQKLAVNRNRIKRILVEAYRTQFREILLTKLNNKTTLTLFFVFIGKEMPTFQTVNRSMKIILEKISNFS